MDGARAVESANVKALREAVALPSIYDALNSDATADGTFTWDGRTFKLIGSWRLPVGTYRSAIRRFRFKATRLWVKYEGECVLTLHTWRCARTASIGPSNSLDTGSFEATGQAAWSGRMLI